MNVTVGLYSFALTELQQQEPRGFRVSYVCVKVKPRLE